MTVQYVRIIVPFFFHSIFQKIKSNILTELDRARECGLNDIQHGIVLLLLLRENGNLESYTVYSSLTLLKVDTHLSRHSRFLFSVFFALKSTLT